MASGRREVVPAAGRSRARWTLALGALFTALVVAAFWPRTDSGAALPDRPAPVLALPLLSDPQRTFSTAEMRGQVWILNAWASWCVACREEHPRLLELARAGIVPIIGLNHRDGRRAAGAWLRQLGDPFRDSLVDADGRAGRELAVRGLPETLVIDRDGVVRYRHAGALTREALERRVLPVVRQLQQ